MRSKVKRLSKAFWQESKKRLPFVLVLLALLFIISQGQKSYARLNENIEVAKINSGETKILSEKIAQISNDNKKLSQDNKALAELNKQLAEQSNKYLACVANLIAKYTRDYQPIVIKDLEKCITTTIKISPETTSSNSEKEPVETSNQEQSSTAVPARKEKNDKTPATRQIFRDTIRGPGELLQFLRQMLLFK